MVTTTRSQARAVSRTGTDGGSVGTTGLQRPSTRSGDTEQAGEKRRKKKKTLRDEETEGAESTLNREKTHIDRRNMEMASVKKGK